jgi:hypothetical protein
METIYLVYTPNDREMFEIIDYGDDKQAMEASRGMASPHRIIKVIDYNNNPELVKMVFLDSGIESEEEKQLNPQHEDRRYGNPLNVPVKDLVVSKYYMYEGTFKQLRDKKYNDDHPNPTYTLRFEDGSKDGRVAKLQPNDTLQLRPSQSAGKRVSRSKRKTPLNKRSRKTRNGLVVKMEK